MKIFWKVIFDPFRWLWNLLNFTRKLILNILLICIFTIFVIFYFQIYFIPPDFKQGALVLDLVGTVVDKPTAHNRFKQISREILGAPNARLYENSLFDIIYAIRQAKNDKNITGLVLSLKDFTGSDQTSLEYIGKVLIEFKNSGKPIYSISDNYTQVQYFLASYANKIYLTPQGTVDLHGLATNNFYYKTFLKNLKINTYVFRVGTYKSAVEPVIRDSMSDAARTADSRWIKRLWKNYLDIISTNRNTTNNQIFPTAQEVLEKLKVVDGNPAQFALTNNLVDIIASRPSIENDMVKVFGWNKNEKSFNKISIYNYQSKIAQNGQIAVIFVNGIIVDGPEKSGFSSGDTIAEQIKQARLDPEIRALIIRINSPGGSVNASEIIRSELVETRASGKPIIISMGGVAASGGYWISTPASYIIASPNTLTGSIGIFGIINTIENTLESIGIYSDGVSTSPLANIAITRKLPIEFLKKMQLTVENGYHNFLMLVAQSRHKTITEVDRIGQGHVWIGTDALKKGLIDQLGDFDDAVHKAAELANLSNYQIKWNDNESSVIEFFTQTKTAMKIIKFCLTYIFPNLEIDKIANLINMNNLNSLIWNDPQNCYAICMSCQKII